MHGPRACPRFPTIWRNLCLSDYGLSLGASLDLMAYILNTVQKRGDPKAAAVRPFPLAAYRTIAALIYLLAVLRSIPRRLPTA